MPNDPAYEKKEGTASHDQSGSETDSTDLREWISFAKTQAVTTELLQFELDALADALEYKAKFIIEAFEELVGLMHQNPQFEKCPDVTKSMSNMVRSLQFQDIAKQKLENISDALKSVHGYANNKITHTEETHRLDTSEVLSNSDNMSQVISERTLAEMRKSMMRNLEMLSKADFEKLSHISCETASEDNNQDNVELF
ncbi:MAG: hypothetical protein ACRBBN_01600 [Methyloligellaceae bacterium]